MTEGERLILYILLGWAVATSLWIMFGPHT